MLIVFEIIESFSSEQFLFPAFILSFFKTDYKNSLCFYVQPPATPRPSPRTPSWITWGATTTTGTESCRTLPVPSTRETRPGHARQGTARVQEKWRRSQIIGTKKFFFFLLGA